MIFGNLILNIACERKLAGRVRRTFEAHHCRPTIGKCFFLRPWPYFLANRSSDSVTPPPRSLADARSGPSPKWWRVNTNTIYVECGFTTDNELLTTHHIWWIRGSVSKQRGLGCHTQKVFGPNTKPQSESVMTEYFSCFQVSYYGFCKLLNTRIVETFHPNRVSHRMWSRRGFPNRCGKHISSAGESKPGKTIGFRSKF